MNVHSYLTIETALQENKEFKFVYFLLNKVCCQQCHDGTKVTLINKY